jgi:type VI secretion system protein ImpL
LIRSDVISQLSQAQKIGDAFFNRKGILDVNFSLEPIRLSSNKRRVVVNVDGQFVEYSHGPRHSVGLIWPNTLRDSAQSKMTLVPNQSNSSPRSIVRKGPWSLFRLLDSSEVVGGTESSVDYNVKLDKGEFAFRISTDASSNLFRERMLHSFRLSETLY